MVSVRKPPRKNAILFMLLSSMLSLRCTGRFGMRTAASAEPWGYFERMTELVTEADPVKKYGSDAHLIRMGHGPIFRSRHKGSISARLI
jgi:hypothetical protein